MNIETLASAWKGHRSFAQWLVHELQPRVTVDLGVDTGYSTFCWAEHNPGHVYGIDSFEGDAHAGFRNTRDQVTHDQQQLGLTNITWIQGWFDAVAKSWTLPIDILHIDGLHTYSAVSEDYANWHGHVRDSGVILFHDTQAFPEIGQFFQELPGFKHEFLHSAGLGIVVKNPQIYHMIVDFKSI